MRDPDYFPMLTTEKFENERPSNLWRVTAIVAVLILWYLAISARFKVLEQRDELKAASNSHSDLSKQLKEKDAQLRQDQLAIVALKQIIHDADVEVPDPNSPDYLGYCRLLKVDPAGLKWGLDHFKKVGK